MKKEKLIIGNLVCLGYLMIIGPIVVILFLYIFCQLISAFRFGLVYKDWIPFFTGIWIFIGATIIAIGNLKEDTPC